MVECKKCFHYAVCVKYDMYGDSAGRCKNFTDESVWIHLPCKIGETVYVVSNKIYETIESNYGLICRHKHGWGIVEKPFDLRMLKELDKKIFLTKEDAEKELKKRNEKMNVL